MRDDAARLRDILEARSMVGMRNILAHGYFEIDPSVIEAVLDRDVPIIARQIAQILDRQ